MSIYLFHLKHTIMYRIHSWVFPAFGILLLLLCLLWMGWPGLLPACLLLGIFAGRQWKHLNLQQLVSFFQKQDPEIDITTRIDGEVQRISTSELSFRRRMRKLHQRAAHIHFQMSDIEGISQATHARVLYSLQHYEVIMKIYRAALEVLRQRRCHLRRCKKEIELLRLVEDTDREAGSRADLLKLEALLESVDDNLRFDFCTQVEEMAGQLQPDASLPDLEMLSERLRQASFEQNTRLISSPVVKQPADDATEWLDLFEEVELDLEQLAFLRNLC